ncbi:MAG: mechanosensitive ion channel [Myxococcota bacterium]|jgi:small-conductance mechanosensitive channel|nr:mechanosensitive ion channel [Myxococcota bacterium]
MLEHFNASVNVDADVAGLVQNWLPKLALAALLFLVFWLFSSLARRAIVAAGTKANVDTHVIRLMATSSRIVLLALGLITALGTLEVDVSALVTGLGLTGFALGFAIKDTISNILAGVLLLIYRPFQVGDNIEVKGMEGKVKSIDLRYTTLAQEEGHSLVPNSLLFTNPIHIGGNKAQE